MAKKSGRRGKKQDTIEQDYENDASGANMQSANADTTEYPKAEPSRAPAASGKRKDTSYETKDEQDEADGVNDSLLTVTSINLKALRSRVKADADAGYGDRATREKAELSKEGDTVIESDALIAALDRLEAAYRELLQR